MMMFHHRMTKLWQVQLQEITCHKNQQYCKAILSICLIVSHPFFISFFLLPQPSSALSSSLDSQLAEEKAKIDEAERLAIEKAMKDAVSKNFRLAEMSICGVLSVVFFVVLIVSFYQTSGGMWLYGEGRSSH
jgi:hypothetical protein